MPGLTTPPNTDQLIAAGSVIKALRAKWGLEAGSVRTVKLGQELIDPALAEKTFDEAAEAGRRVASSAPGLAGRMTDAIERKMDSFEKRLSTTKVGRAVNRVLKADPEHIADKTEIQIDLADGRHLKMPLDVVRTKASRRLQRLSKIAELVAVVPIVGKIAPALLGIGSGIGSLVARAVGSKAVSRSLAGMAEKHLALAGISFVPGLGEASVLRAAVEDNRNEKALARGPKVADISALTPRQTP